jgi:hypothetical protein
MGGDVVIPGGCCAAPPAEATTYQPPWRRRSAPPGWCAAVPSGHDGGDVEQIHALKAVLRRGDVSVSWTGIISLLTRLGGVSRRECQPEFLDQHAFSVLRTAGGTSRVTPAGADAATVRPGWEPIAVSDIQIRPATATFDHDQPAPVDQPGHNPVCASYSRVAVRLRLAKCTRSSPTNPLLSNADHHRDASWYANG